MVHPLGLSPWPPNKKKMCWQHAGREAWRSVDVVSTADRPVGMAAPPDMRSYLKQVQSGAA